ncbi:MAG: tRNA (N6-isopentenyl adenosine(37)-C2)-methylthiotransferase MiaB [Nitrospiraceae bacterium]|nr:tRNA (N6-isopentenyl adenosine(37)-C2)-methylthiotransferase MiaB [Nitrospiraceae bacterium]
MRKSVYIYTYGCQMNVHDSEKMLGILDDQGYAPAENPEEADLIIFNTCAIREKAEQKFYSQLGRTKMLKRRRNELKIAVAGCVAQETKERLFGRVPHVDFIVGPQNIHLIGEMIGGERRAALLDDNRELASTEVAARRGSEIKAWVSIMYGCNNFCSYCIVPLTRGREVSRPSSAIISEIRSLSERGYKEVTLLGQNVSSYCSDINFPQLLRRIDVLGIERIRFVTSHPRDLSDELIRAVAELPHVCEHIHLPIQSGSSEILSRMNRGYTYEEYMGKIERIRSEVPHVSITADVIAGFPGETRRDHEETLRALRVIEYDGIFAFKYSPRKGTKAAGMAEGISDEEKSLRLGEILKLQEEITLRKNRALEGTVQEILVEGPSETDGTMLMGRTRTNKIVTVADDGYVQGSLLKVLIEQARHHSLSGRPLSR